MNLMVVVMVALVVVSSHVLGQENAADALLKFKTALVKADPALGNWNPSTAPCTGNTGNWAGVLCFNGYVVGLQLDNMGLQGQIDVDTLTGLQFLRTLSFTNNDFQGPMPDWRKLPTLTSLYLSGNQFSGQIPDDAFNGMDSLKKVYLSDNKFTGPIPASLASPRMVELGLANNQFSGGIPHFSSENLQVFNVSNNQLQGPIPPSMLKLDPSSFTGNTALCEGASCEPPPDMEPILHPLPPSQAKRKKISPAIIAIIVLSVMLALFLLLLLLLLCRWWCMDDDDDDDESETPRQGMMKSEMRSPLPRGAVSVSVGASPQQQATKLSFVRDDRQKFDLQDLMRASAEMLGSGSFGASYKAVLVDGEALVVKRFKQMTNISKEDFHDHMRRLSRLKHPNLLPLVAYLYRKEEKLLVFDFITNNSLGKHLHDDGKRPEEWPKPFNWPCRLKAIKGVLRGLAYLHAELPALDAPHGHLKSSNVLLDSNYNALLMDYTLSPIVNPTQISQALVAYKCPEYALTGQTSRKSDVWCLGILILETLTGKPVDKQLGQQYGPKLAGWVKGIVEEANAKGAVGVFDKDMEISVEAEVEMEKLLQIGIGCCQEELDKRLGLDEALRKIEQLHE
ncbi:pollen receptor-like kinase 4 [Salvia miltiorrhiza]|uniref:pollen receptor-like kinase 4 n=1 Tax=Salvia miltiorrhiza TaxID=226208 RepID=UPI0025AD27B8|nr:pollen receptor-like kinase 4 [Salvia miltiorrhiza]